MMRRTDVDVYIEMRWRTVRDRVHVASFVVKFVWLFLGLADVQNHHGQPIFVKIFFKAGLVAFLIVLLLELIGRTRRRAHQQLITIPGPMHGFPPEHTKGNTITGFFQVVLAYDPDEAAVLWYPWCDLLSVPTMSVHGSMPILTWPLGWRSWQRRRGKEGILGQIIPLKPMQKREKQAIPRMCQRMLHMELCELRCRERSNGLFLLFLAARSSIVRSPFRIGVVDAIVKDG